MLAAILMSLLPIAARTAHLRPWHKARVTLSYIWVPFLKAVLHRSAPLHPGQRNYATGTSTLQLLSSTKHYAMVNCIEKTLVEAALGTPGLPRLAGQVAGLLVQVLVAVLQGPYDPQSLST
jgi:hypothetical protein